MITGSIHNGTKIKLYKLMIAGLQFVNNTDIDNIYNCLLE